MSKKLYKRATAITFSERCYRLLAQVPPGRVTTYAALAAALGTRAYRAVGNSMNRNPSAPEVPCHRVVKSDGSIGGYAYGVKRKILLLKSEGVTVTRGKVEDFRARLFSDF